MENIFPKQLKEYRNNKHFTQEDIAKKLYISRQAISKWESGDITPDLNNLIKLCNIFDCSLDELIFGKKKEEKKDSIFDYIFIIGIFVMMTAIFIFH